MRALAAGLRSYHSLCGSGGTSNRALRGRISSILLNARLMHEERSTSEAKTPLFALLRQRILASGPMTVHEYMRNVLTNPKSGYYMHRDVFGASGDFTTSPEVSQMFGEMIGVWFVHEWRKAGSPGDVRLIEMGPGRGTLTEDILRVFAKYDELVRTLSVHLVEVSGHLAKLQQERLCGGVVSAGGDDAGGKEPFFQQGKTKRGVPISWYRDIRVVPQGSYAMYLAHEFLDALPIHKFVQTERGWREVLVDLTPQPTAAGLNLRFVLAPNATPSTIFIQRDEKRHHVEVCPEAGVFVQHVAKRLNDDGGSALIVDYGHLGDKGDTFRAFRQHQLHDPLSLPGDADLTADVDFAYLQRCVQNQAVTFGPVNQGNFLTEMGMGIRLRKLLEVAKSRSEAELLVSAYDMLVNPNQMGERFKFMAMFPNAMATALGLDPPAGFLAQSTNDSQL